MISNLIVREKVGRALLFLPFFIFAVLHAVDPLPSWKDGEIKSALLQFVQATTDKEGKDYIPPEKRIATFDQDGTLWVEQPMYSQMFFAMDRLKKMAPDHPEWKGQEPYKSLLEGNMKDLNEQAIQGLIAVTHAGMSVADFHALVRDWLKTAVHPRFKKPYTQLVYKPMLEVIKLFSEHGFTNYIVSGGGQEFIRVYADEVYGIPTEHVIGSASKVKYEYRDGHPVLMRLPEVLYIDDKTGKPEGINLIIGKRPIAAFGNSLGDREMLEWTQAGGGKRFMLLVHHDDPVREYAYDEPSKIGTFPKTLMEEAKKRGWFVVSMKDDWLEIF